MGDRVIKFDVLQKIYGGTFRQDAVLNANIIIKLIEVSAHHCRCKKNLLLVSMTPVVCLFTKLSINKAKLFP
ncbi:unnamed protein product [Phytomonas sp. EM1]|nr:unnamed protein product [Phytomonas sp. EM1]|eukprot:CCW63545.1 unnamed protein product [Phytomonas sp. isolate EM1]